MSEQGTKKIERLLLPRSRMEPSVADQPFPETKVPLPKWKTIPLDAKFPVVPAPKGEVTYVTTKLGQAPYKSTQRKDFDLSDPLNRTNKTDYQPLFDPYLKGWFSKPSVQKQMRQSNLITEKGNVPVSIREYNDYRFYLRRKALMEGEAATHVQDPIEMARERRKSIINKTKMKAEVFGVEVKYKTLKAKQAAQEHEEERRKELLQRSQNEEERLKQRSAEEEQKYLASVKNRQKKMMKKMDTLKERSETMKKRAEEKLIRFELNAQDKLNKLDYLREQRFQELDQKRKMRWHLRRREQMRELKQTQMQKQRVEAEMRTLRRRYEDEMTRKLAKDEVKLNMAKESRAKTKELRQETYARRMARVLKETNYMMFGSSAPPPTHTQAGGQELNRHASTWMVQEVLHRLGLGDEPFRPSKDGSYSYLNELERAMSLTVQRLENVSVLGEEQEMLSRLTHLCWRRVKAAYPGKTSPKSRRRSSGRTGTMSSEDMDKQLARLEAGEEVEDAAEDDLEEKEEEEEKELPPEELAESKIMEDTIDEDFTTGEQLAWIFPDADDGEEREQAVKMSMIVSGDLDRRKLRPGTMLGDPRPLGPTREVEEKMDEFFKTHMRMTETDALTIEAELIRFLETLKEENMSKDELKKVLALCIRLANHDEIERSDPCGDLETNPDGHVFSIFDPDQETVNEESENKDADATGDADLASEQTDAAGVGPDSVKTERADGDQSEAEQLLEGSSVDPDGGVGSAVGGGVGADVGGDAGEEVAGEEAQDQTENARTARRNVNANKRDQTETDCSIVSNSVVEGHVETSNVNVKDDLHESDDKLAGIRYDSDSDDSSRRTSRRTSGRTSPRTSGRTSRSRSVSQQESTSASQSCSDSDSERDTVNVSGSESKVSNKHSEADFNDNKSDPKDKIARSINELLSDGLNISQNADGEDGDEPEEEREGEEGEEGEEEVAVEDGEPEDEETQREASEVAQETAEDGKPDDTETPETKSEQKESSSKGASFHAGQSQQSVARADPSDYLVFQEIQEQKEFDDAIEKNDHVGVATHILSKIQEREKLRGVAIPQSRLLRFVSFNLSNLWKRGPNDSLHKFGDWLKDPTTPDAIRSLIYNIKRRRFPDELQVNMAKAVVTTCLEGVAYDAMPLTDGLVNAVLHQFMEDLENDQVSMAILENVLYSLVDEYKYYAHKDTKFNTSVLIVDCLGWVYEQVVAGTFTKKDHLLPAIKNWNSLDVETRATFECGNWANLFHRAAVMIRLDMLSEEDWNILLKLTKSTLAEHLWPDHIADIKEMLDMMRNRMTVPKYKRAFSIDLCTNLVVNLLDSLQTTNINSTTLLPGQQDTSQSACTEKSPSVLGCYTTAESIVLLTIDKLASDMGRDVMTKDYLDQTASSLIDLLITYHKMRADDFDGEKGFDVALEKLNTLTTSFLEVKRMLAAMIRPYLSSTARDVAEKEDDSRALPPLASLPLTDEQANGLIVLITDVYVAFVQGVMRSMTRAGVNVKHLPNKILVLYVWRALAFLAKQAKSVLQEISDEHAIETVNTRVKPSDSLIIERIYHSVIDVADTNANKIQRFEDDEHHSEDVFSSFIRGIVRKNNKPGYVPVIDIVVLKEEIRIMEKKRRKPSLLKRNTATEILGEPGDTPEEQELRGKPTPENIDRALRRELIACARCVSECLVSHKALVELRAKTADIFVGTVFIMEKLLGNLYNKLIGLQFKIKKGKVLPNDLNKCILGVQQCETLPDLQLNRNSAVKVIKHAIIELEEQYTAAITMSRMAECLSRAAHNVIENNMENAPSGSLTEVDMSSRLQQPHPTLASASPVMLSQWMRSCLLVALQAVTILISGGEATPSKLDVGSSYGSSGQPKGKPPTVDPVGIYLASSYVAVHNMISRLRDTIENQKTMHQSGGVWMAPNVASTTETSEIGVPIEIVDKVFARLAGSMQALSEAPRGGFDENDGREPDGPTFNLAFTMINQVTSAVSYHVEVGHFPMIRINDLLTAKKAAEKVAARPKASDKRPQKTASKPIKIANTSSTNTSENNRGLNMSLNNSDGILFTLENPVDKIESRWSQKLYKSMVSIVGLLDSTLRESLELSLLSADPDAKDAKVRARAHTSSWLDKLQRQAGAHDLLLMAGNVKTSRMEYHDHGLLKQNASDTVAQRFIPAKSSSSVSRKVSNNCIGNKKAIMNTSCSNINKTWNRGSSTNAGQVDKQSRVTTHARSSSLVQYVRNLLKPLREPLCTHEGYKVLSAISSTKNISNNKSSDVVSEILHAGYLVSYELFQNFEKSWNTMNTTRNGTEVNKYDSFLSILVLDALLEQLTATSARHARGNGLADVINPSSSLLRQRDITMGKKGLPFSSPYISSYKYERPDPYGAYYAEVVDRGRRWSKLVEVGSHPPTQTSAEESPKGVDVPRIHSLTQGLLSTDTRNRPLDYTSEVASIIDIASRTSNMSSSQPSSTACAQQGYRRPLRPKTTNGQANGASRGNNINNSRRRLGSVSKGRNRSLSESVTNNRGTSVPKTSSQIGQKLLKPQPPKNKDDNGDAIFNVSNPRRNQSASLPKRIVQTAQTSVTVSKPKSTTVATKAKRSASKESNSQPVRTSRPTQRKTGSTTNAVRSQSNSKKIETFNRKPQPPSGDKNATILWSKRRVPMVKAASKERSLDTDDANSTPSYQNLAQENGEGKEKTKSVKSPKTMVEVIYHVNENTSREAMEVHLHKMRKLNEQDDGSATVKPQTLHLVLLSLLSNDLPRETAILRACLKGQGRFKLTSLADVTDILSLVDHVLMELPFPFDQGHHPERDLDEDGNLNDDKESVQKNANCKVKLSDVTRQLKAACDNLEVSQRSAGAVHSLLRSIECSILPDEEITSALHESSSKVSQNMEINVGALKAQLKSSLAELVERLEEGHAPRCMTSSNWNRLAKEIFAQTYQDAQGDKVDEHLVQVDDTCSEVCTKDDQMRSRSNSRSRSRSRSSSRSSSRSTSTSSTRSSSSNSNNDARSDESNIDVHEDEATCENCSQDEEPIAQLTTENHQIRSRSKQKSSRKSASRTQSNPSMSESSSSQASSRSGSPGSTASSTSSHCTSQKVNCSSIDKLNDAGKNEE